MTTPNLSDEPLQRRPGLVERWEGRPPFICRAELRLRVDGHGDTPDEAIRDRDTKIADFEPRLRAALAPSPAPSAGREGLTPDERFALDVCDQYLDLLKPQGAALEDPVIADALTNAHLKFIYGLACRALTVPPLPASASPDASEAVDDNDYGDGYEDRAVARLKVWMGGEGDLLTNEQVRQAWQEFCTAFSASWLIDSDGMRGNFCGFLIGRSLAATPVSSATKGGEE